MVEFGVIQMSGGQNGSTAMLQVLFFHFCNLSMTYFLACDGECQNLNRNNPGWDYTGSTSKTVDDIPCQKWNSQYPHRHDQPEWDHNFCRNPDSSDGGVWCYTTVRLKNKVQD